MDISSISTNYTVANADKSAEQSNSLQSSLKNISSDSSEEQLKGVIKDFESYCGAGHQTDERYIYLG